MSTLLLTVDYSTPVSSAVTSVTQGYAVCSPIGQDGYAVADTTNLALAGGKASGVALATGNARTPIPVAVAGLINAETVGALSGTGDYVEFTSTGALQRNTAVASNTIGKYLPNGDVIVDLGLQYGSSFTGNATSIQSVSVTSASAASSYILAGDGTALRSRRDKVYNFLDFKVAGVGPDETGATDCSAHLALALATIPNYSTLYIPRPSSYFLLKPTQPITYYDDVAGGQKRGIHILGEGGPSHEGGQYHFRANMTRAEGTTASVTARTNGGSGDNHQTWTIDAGKGVTAATKSRWIGRFFCTYGAANDENNCDGLIVDVPSDNTIRVSNKNSSASNTDANNGAIGWWIDEPLLDLRAKDIALTNLAFGMIVSGGVAGKLGAFIEFNQAPGQTASPVLACRMFGCKFESDTATNGTFRDAIWIARDMVATSSSGNSAWKGFNGVGPTTYGAGEYQACQPTQTDTFVFEQCSFSGAIRSGVAFWSASAQSKENRLVECRFGASGTMPMQIGVGVPRDVKNGGQWVPYGNAHFDVIRGSFGFIRDACVQLGGYGSKNFIIEGCYSENASMALRANTNTSNTPIELRDNNWTFTSTYKHRSGQHIKTNGGGPLLISGGALVTPNDGHEMHVEINSAPSAYETHVTVEDFMVFGRSDYARRYAFRVSTLRGPYNFSPSGTYSLKITSDAGTSEVSITQASMNAANFGNTVDLTQVHTWQLAQWIDANFTGTTAWGEGDDSYVYIRTKNLTGTGTIQVFTPGAGTDANTKIGFATTLDNAGAQTQMNKDQFFVDWTKASGTGGKTHLVTRGLLHVQVSGPTQLVCNDIDKRYNSGALGKRVVENTQGLSSTNGVTPKNLNGSVDIADAATSATVAFATAEDDASYRVTTLAVGTKTGAPAAASYRAHWANKTTSGFDIVLEAAPGAGTTVTVEWMVTR